MQRMCIVGRLDSNPIKHFDSDGKQFVTFSLVVNMDTTFQPVQIKSKAEQIRVVYYDMTAYDEYATYLIQNAVKGTEVYVMGELSILSATNSKSKLPVKLEVDVAVISILEDIKAIFDRIEPCL